ncbi:SdiA-regulated domain-containing protein [Pseudomonas xanthosomatis]|uniref:SdiA-regulated domain-containing protein n=1 Tax=Pseudomonas xanthosomatis TaxID=2842356 RepID=UPI003F5A66C5
MVIPSAASRSSAPKRKLWLRWPVWLGALAVIAYCAAMAMHWDDRGLLWLKERFQSSAVRQESIWLPDYVVDIDAKPLPGMERDEASDLSFNPHTRTLFAVMGKHPFLTELDLDGNVLRKIPLEGWANPEAVAVMEDGLIGIVDERQHDLVMVKVDASTTSLKRSDYPGFELGDAGEGNKGFEGLAWDAMRQRLLIGEERPPKLYAWSSDGRSPLKGEKHALPSDQLDLRNLSALAVDPRTGHLLALSADSNMLLELDEKGDQVSFMALLGGFNGLKAGIPRAEGVTMDEQGNLYFVSEPNLFYRFRKN